MTLTFWEVAKILGLALTGGLGALAVFGDFRTEDNRRITRLGRWMLVGIACSVGLTIIATLHDDREQQNTLSDQLNVNGHVLKQLSQLLTPLGQFQAHLTLLLSAHDDVAKRYIDRIDQPLELLANTPGAITSTSLAAKLAVSKMNGSAIQPVRVEIPSDSPYYPNADERAIGDYQNRLNLAVSIFSRDTKCCAPNAADLTAYGHMRGETRLMYDLERKCAVWDLGGRELETGQSTGVVSSIPDLAGATLQISPVFAIGAEYPRAPAFVSTIQIEAAMITLAPGRVLWLSGKSLERAIDKDGNVRFAATLPNDPAELAKALNPDVAKAKARAEVNANK